MDAIYFETNNRNKLIYILTHMEVNNNKMLINLRFPITVAPLISNSYTCLTS